MMQEIEKTTQSRIMRGGCDQFLLSAFGLYMALVCGRYLKEAVKTNTNM